MWLLIALLAAWCFAALVEDLHWRYWRRPLDLMVRAAYERQAHADLHVLLMMNGLVDLTEQLYESTSSYGVPYPVHTRHYIAAALGEARKVILDRVGPAPYVIYERSPTSWPFDAEGKVKP